MRDLPHRLIGIAYSFTRPEGALEVPSEEEVADIDAPMIINIPINGQDRDIVDPPLKVKAFLFAPVPLALEEAFKITREV